MRLSYVFDSFYKQKYFSYVSIRVTSCATINNMKDVIGTFEKMFYYYFENKQLNFYITSISFIKFTQRREGVEDKLINSFY